MENVKTRKTTKIYGKSNVKTGDLTNMFFSSSIEYKLEQCFRGEKIQGMATKCCHFKSSTGKLYICIFELERSSLTFLKIKFQKREVA